MHQIIKFCDLTLDQVAALDKVLKSEAMKSDESYELVDDRPQPGGGFARAVYHRIIFARKLRVKGDKTGKFMYELVIASTVGTYEQYPKAIKCPARVIEAINAAVEFCQAAN